MLSIEERCHLFKVIDSTHISAITDLVTGTYYSSEDFKNEIKKRISYFLENFEVSKNAPVLILESNSANFFINFFCFYFLEIPIIPFNEQASKFEVDNVIKYIKPQLILRGNSFEFLENGSGLTIPCALILFTSGTTGIPKGVIISRQAIEYKINQLKKNIKLNEIQNSLCFISTFFGHGLIGNSIFPIFSASNFFIMKKLTVETALELYQVLDTNKINFFSSVPSHWELFIKLKLNFKNLESLKRVQCASSVLRVETAKIILERIPGHTKFYDVYGATELLSWYAERPITISTYNSPFAFYDNDHYFRDRQLIVSSKNYYSGYVLGDKIKNESEFQSNDLFESGLVVGRMSNVVNKSGIKYQIEELENEYYQFKGAIELVVFSILDRMYGEKIGVALVLAEGVSEIDFKTFCQLVVPVYRRPQCVFVVDQIPKNDRGKVDRSLLLKNLEISS